MIETLRAIDWQAVITSLITSTTFISIVIGILVYFLKRIGLKSDKIDSQTNETSKKVTAVLEKQQDLNVTIQGVVAVTKEIVSADESLHQIYKEATELVASKIELINDFKAIINKYRSED